MKPSQIGKRLQKKTDLPTLERQLEAELNPASRLSVALQLIRHFSLTNIPKAEELLQRATPWVVPDIDMEIQLAFFLLKGFVDNQLYRFESASGHYQAALELAEELGDFREQASSYIDYAGVCINLNQLDEANEWLEKASRRLKSVPDMRLQARLLCREGYLYLHYSDFSKAIESFLQAEKRLNSLKSPLDLVDCYFLTLIYSGLGKVYERNSEWEKSTRAYEQVADMCETLEMRTRLSWHYLNVGNGYLAMNHFDGAERFFLKAIDERDDASLLARASAYANLGYLYYQQGDRYDDALQLFDRAEQLFKPDDHYNRCNLERWRAHIFLDQELQEKAMERFIGALNHARKSENFQQLANIYKDIAAFHADMGDYAGAYEYQLLGEGYSEKFAVQVNQRKIVEMEVKYEAEKKKKEAELLRLQATQLQLKALRAQMNPHFLFNALNAIQHYITANEVKNAAKYLAKFAQLMRKSLEFSDLESIPLEKEIGFLEDYLTINARLRFEDRLKFEIILDEEIEEDIIGVPTMIVQPYVENAIEHGLRTRDNGLIRIQFSPLGEQNILCVVEDNGIGREAAAKLRQDSAGVQSARSRGTRITEKRLQLLHQSKDSGVFVKTIDLKEESTKKALGTRVEITIPIVELPPVSEEI